jgi:hypothetical protein
VAPRPKERSLTGESYWLSAKPEGFTKLVEELWRKKHDGLLGIGPGQTWIKPEQP